MFQKNIFEGLKVLITAGPTREAIDPVRFISNHSTGKMGYAIAEEFYLRGAEVILITGPVNIGYCSPGIQLVSVTTADEMYEACNLYFQESDMIVLAAAVADYKPKVVASQKIKKKDAELSIELVKTIDIAAALGKQKLPGQILIGFALETENEIENAIKKLHAKNLDLIVLNSLQNQGAGFGHDTNQITLIDRTGTIKDFDLKHKTDVARDIVNSIALLSARHSETSHLALS